MSAPDGVSRGKALVDELGVDRAVTVVEAAAAVILLDEAHRRAVARVGGEAVDGLGRDGHAGTLRQQACCVGQSGAVGEQSQGLHS